MPTYEYECTSCGHRFERRQSITEGPLTQCPECDGGIRRVLFPVGIVFKGSGFYVTDNRKSSPMGGGDKPSTSDTGGDKGDSKSETKVETKVETTSGAGKESVAAASKE